MKTEADATHLPNCKCGSGPRHSTMSSTFGRAFERTGTSHSKDMQIVVHEIANIMDAKRVDAHLGEVSDGFSPLPCPSQERPFTTLHTHFPPCPLECPT